MKTLVIDTSSGRNFLALLEKDQLIKVLFLPFGQALSKDIFPHLQKLFLETKASLEEITCIAAGVGPGSYTGTRTGVSAARSLAFGRKISLIPFCSLMLFQPKEIQKFAITLQSKAGHFFVFTGEETPSAWAYKLSAHVSPENLSSTLQGFSCILENPYENPSIEMNFSHLAKVIFAHSHPSKQDSFKNLEIIYLNTSAEERFTEDFIFHC